MTSKALFNQVLVVDDDPASTFLIELTLREENLARQIHTFHSAQAALAFVEATCSPEQNGPDLILLDLNMPVMNGFDFMEALRTSGRSQLIKERVVVLTSSTSNKDKEKVRAYQVRDFLTKPLSLQALQTLLP